MKKNTTTLATVNATSVKADNKNTRIMWTNVSDNALDALNDWLDSWTQNTLDTMDKNAEIKLTKEKLTKKLAHRDEILAQRAEYTAKNSELTHSQLMSDLDNKFPVTAVNRDIARLEKALDTGIAKDYKDKLAKSRNDMKSAYESLLPDSFYPAYLHARNNGDMKPFMTSCIEFAKNVGLWSPNKKAMEKFCNLMFTRMCGDTNNSYTNALKNGTFTKAKSEKTFYNLGIRVFTELLLTRSVQMVFDEKTARPALVHRDFTLSLDEQTKYQNFLESKCADKMTKQLAKIQREYVDSKKKSAKAEKTA